MFARKRTTLAAVGGTVLALAVTAAPVQAQGTADDVEADPEVVEAEGEMTAEEVEAAAEKAGEEVEMAAEKAGEKIEDGAVAAKEGAEEMGEEIEENGEAAGAVVADALDDSERAERLQQQLGTHPELGVYQLEVTDIDGRYTVSGMIDKSEDYAELEQILADVDGVPADMIDNNVVQN